MKIQTLSIVAGSEACNADCPFCVSKMTIPNGVPKGKAPPVHWRNFKKACRLAQLSGVTTAMITGKGEPTLFPDQVCMYLEEMRPYDFPIIEIQTNGIPIYNRLKSTASRGLMREALDAWYKLGLTTFAISVVGCDPELNRKIYVPHLGSYIDLPELIAELKHDSGMFSVRLACVMIKGGVDSPEKVLEMARFAKDNEVDQLTLRPVNKPDSEQSQDDATFKWVSDNFVDEPSLARTQRMLEADASKLMTLDNGGVVYDLHGQNVCLTHSLTRAPETSDLRQLIFFPNGRVSFDWSYTGAVLF